MTDSLGVAGEAVHGNALKGMYRALRKELGLTVTPPTGSKKDSLAAAILELREKLKVHLTAADRQAQQKATTPPVASFYGGLYGGNMCNVKT